MPAHIADELSTTTLKWVGLAALQMLVATLLWLGGDAGAAWRFLEPLLVVIAAIYVLRTGSYRVAVAMLAYLVIAVIVGLGAAYHEMAAAQFSTAAIFEALRPIHRIKEIAELVLLEGAWKAMRATRELRRVRAEEAVA
jgi:hypothetical protein